MLRAELRPHFEVLECPEASALPYFCATLVRRETIRALSFAWHPLRNSGMGRHAIVAQLEARQHTGQAFSCVNTHLESGGTASDVRLSQLRTLAELVRERGQEVPCVLLGDTNLRDAEKSEAERRGWLSGLADGWDVDGRDPLKAFTWDARRNSNIRTGRGDQQARGPRFRFDRVLYGHDGAARVGWRQGAFALVGTNAVPTAEGTMFLSDHFGVLCEFLREASSATESAAPPA